MRRCFILVHFFDSKTAKKGNWKSLNVPQVLKHLLFRICVSMITHLDAKILWVCACDGVIVCFFFKFPACWCFSAVLILSHNHVTRAKSWGAYFYILITKCLFLFFFLFCFTFYKEYLCTKDMLVSRPVFRAL